MVATHPRLVIGNVNVACRQILGIAADNPRLAYTKRPQALIGSETRLRDQIGLTDELVRLTELTDDHRQQRCGNQALLTCAR